ncbi:hypothetical protein U9M48_032440 [Paspalum notatum var. saurae]|uniref:Uncharacterized protein n=1 Tax=Paspalum notatum var. saurae TaxID=547442 RepID=A0AAQ3X5E4_PASNO
MECNSPKDDDPPLRFSIPSSKCTMEDVSTPTTSAAHGMVAAIADVEVTIMISDNKVEPRPRWILIVCAEDQCV